MTFPRGTVIIPAHNEQAVIARTLEPLRALAGSGHIEVIVACNGCTDRTAQIARTYPGVIVLETSTPSKVAALNDADRKASNYPRLYLDADITLTPSALRMTFEYLNESGSLSARPAFEYDTHGASVLVRAFYRARARIPSTNAALWGAGAYGLSLQGRNRFAQFPDIVADDLFVDRLFSTQEKKILPTIPVKVCTPRNSASLLAVLGRNYRGQAQLKNNAQPLQERPHATGGTGATLRLLIQSISGPVSAAQAAVYTGFVLLARAQANTRGRRHGIRWERDETSRQAV